MIQRVSDPFDDLVMDSNKSLKSIYKGSRRNGVRMAKRKKGMTFIPYDYEAAYNKSLDDNAERRDVSVLWILHGCVRSEVVVCSI